jgi:hypothetical protein
MARRRIDAQQRSGALVNGAYARQYDLAYDLLDFRTIDCALPVNVYGKRNYRGIWRASSVQPA